MVGIAYVDGVAEGELMHLRTVANLLSWRRNHCKTF